jgi:hypothetical protein
MPPQASTSYTDPAVSVNRKIIERHPLFATRLCYQTEGFFWSWASASDFRSELDALRSWRRASASKRPTGATANAGPPRTQDGHDSASMTAAGSREDADNAGLVANGVEQNLLLDDSQGIKYSQSCSDSDARAVDDLYPNPTEVFIDLSVLSLASAVETPTASEREHSSQGERRHRRVRRRRSSRSSTRPVLDCVEMDMSVGAPACPEGTSSLCS